MLVSAIITTKNRIAFLEKAINSVFQQTYKDIECIVVDDASSDGTEKFCASLEDGGKIHYIRIPDNESKGGNYARNLGAKTAKGEYLAYLDDDDEWKPNKIEEQVKLAQQTGSGLIYCLREWHSASSSRISYEATTYSWEGDLSNKIFRHYITSTSCLLIKRELLFDVGGFDEQLPKWQEYELMMRLCQHTKVYYVHDYLVAYLINNSDKSRLSNKSELNSCAIIKIYKKHKKLILKKTYTAFCFVDMSVCEIYKVAKRGGDTKYMIYSFPWAYPSILFHKMKYKIKKLFLMMISNSLVNGN